MQQPDESLVFVQAANSNRACSSGDGKHRQEPNKYFWRAVQSPDE